MKHTELTRVRESGTRVTLAKDGKEVIAACRSIVANCTYEKINGVMVDLFSASAIVKVYDALSDANKEKFLGLSIARMASVSFSLLK